MSAESAIWSLVQQLVGIGRTAADQAAGLVSLVGLAGEPRSGPTCALPGHYGVLRSARNVVFLRTGRGAIVLGYITTPPEDAEAGDAGIITDDGCHLRLRGGVLSVRNSTGSELLKIDVSTGQVTLGDPLFPIPSVPPSQPVARNLDPVSLGGVTVGAIQATSTKVVGN